MFAYPVLRQGASLFALIAVIAMASPARAQQPSASTIAVAKEVIALKGATNMYDPLVPGVIEHAKSLFMQTNPMLARDLNDVAAQLRKEMAPKQQELVEEAARLYAARFTEQELKDILAFYKTPLGKKVIEEEPKILESSMTSAQNWANKLSEDVIGRFRAEMKRKGHDL
jgi:hypothetical protein